MSHVALAIAMLTIEPSPLPAVADPAPTVLVAATDGQATPPSVPAAPPQTALVPPPAQADAQPVQPPTAVEPEPEENEIVVTGRRHDKADPFEAINAESFAVTQAVDGAVIRPVAKAYQRVLPGPLRDGIRNFLNNLREPVIFINFLLQHKVGKAARTFERFAVNSTVGVGGLVDVASRKPFRIARRPNGFADTLGFYGVKTGVFLFLPIVGPTTVRDLIGSTIDRFVLPFAVGGPFKNAAVTIPAGIFGTLDHRAQFDETYEQLHKNTPDAYVASREFYLARRQAEIDELRGKGHRTVTPKAGSIRPTVVEDSPRK